MSLLTITTADYDVSPDTGYMLAIIAITFLILIIVLLYLFLNHDNDKESKKLKN